MMIAYKRIILMSLAILLLAMSVNALGQKSFMGGEQPGIERRQLREDIENFRIFKLSQSLDLTTKQSEKFFPVYNEFKKKRDDLEQEKRNTIESIGKAVELPDYPEENLKELLSKLDKIMEDDIKLRQELRNGMLKILSMHQVAKLEIFEHRFKHEIQRLIRESRNRGMNKRPFNERQ
ncbi:MAG: hypothetical protein GY855_13795 [candidate division Zixibacteria bacterium]|nr:hypothetical protein [candidate division Zixibacteria bacterium]